MDKIKFDTWKQLEAYNYFVRYLTPDSLPFFDIVLNDDCSIKVTDKTGASMILRFDSSTFLVSEEYL